MFHHLDSALRSLLISSMPAGTEISFDTPSPAWARHERTAPALNLFLHQIRDDAKVRLGSWIERRDGAGRLVAREQAPREYRSCYLLTAWATDIDQEHSLLGSALAILAAHETIQAPYLPEALASTGFPVTVAVANPALPCAGTDLWSALDIPPRAGVDLVITVAVVPSVITDLTPPARRIELGVAGTVPAPANAPASGPIDTQVREHVNSDARKLPSDGRAERPDSGSDGH
ncbi:DUF4255 domain-containing protein [Amycolatopsis sp. H20-H5]|uniref:DUF4255 domain-containing protein n=1 Tax=Amycolatopsis sp. H20-H5 TaxID=3046309 RepID=UPI002DB978FA|nr:DUF4255 domain-containing protein [Amycolatopsis sp. H20-H5]MEC3978754.1 DUF4255 domain-containing protein [Amycolatopsis sp. H20-H5]